MTWVTEHPVMSVVVKITARTKNRRCTMPPLRARPLVYHHKGPRQAGHAAQPGLKDELKNHVGRMIGSFAKPDEIRFTDALPKTRSGKIMRRLLKEVASGNKTPQGDTSTLEDFSVLAKLGSSDE